MATVRVPPNCQGMTLTTSGAVVASGNLITTTALEATTLVSPYAFPGSQPIQFENNSTGAITMIFPVVITNITINSIGYAVTNGISAPVPAADATAFMAGLRQREPSFELVSG